MGQSDLLIEVLGTDSIESLVFEIFFIVINVELLREMLDTARNEVLVVSIAQRGVEETVIAVRE